MPGLGSPHSLWLDHPAEVFTGPLGLPCPLSLPLPPPQQRSGQMHNRPLSHNAEKSRLRVEEDEFILPSTFCFRTKLFFSIEAFFLASTPARGQLSL